MFPLTLFTALMNTAALSAYLKLFLNADVPWNGVSRNKIERDWNGEHRNGERVSEIEGM